MGWLRAWTVPLTVWGVPPTPPAFPRAPIGSATLTVAGFPRGAGGRVEAPRGRRAGALVTVGREKWMSHRSTMAHAAVTIASTRARASAAVSRFGPRLTGGGGGGGTRNRNSGSGTNHGDGKLHSGASAGVPK